MRFVKMHGCGNDYILLDAFADRAVVDRPAWRAHVPAMCDRRRGIGADGVIVVGPGAAGLDARAEVLNADGSPGGMCGNGLRMAARLLIEGEYTRSDAGVALAIEMGGRVIRVAPEIDARGCVARAEADMGPPVLEPTRVPVTASLLERAGEHAWRLGPHEMTFVSMGNPHAVLFVEELPDASALARLGKELEHHRAFPERMNIQFARIIEPELAAAATWERGAGATLACGTGACAVCVAGVLTGRADRRLRVRMPGGDLDLRWDNTTGHVWLGGPVARAFAGEWSPE